MIRHGKVQTFNPLTGTGFMCPEGGGELLPFRQVDVQRQSGQEIRESQRFTYEVDNDHDGEEQAINIRPV